MEEAPLLGALAEAELGPELFADGFAKVEDDALQVLRDAYLGEPEPRARTDGAPDGDLLGDLALDPAPAYSVHFLSSLLGPHRGPVPAGPAVPTVPAGPTVLPLGAWARDAHPGLRVIPVEIKEAGAAGASAEDAAFQSSLVQESCCKFPPPQEVEDASACSYQKDSSPMVICQLAGRTQMLCADNSATGEINALHLLPQHRDQNDYLQPDAPKPMTTLVGRLLPVPAKLNLITQQLDNGGLPAAVNGSAFPSASALPGPPKITLAGYCDCFASGDLCNNCSCGDCCHSLRHELERLKALKARIMCSSTSKCLGCRNHEDSPERRTLVTVSSCLGAGDFEGSHHLSPPKSSGPQKLQKDGSSCISWEVVEATCACLLAQGEEAERERCPPGLAEQRVLEEFGRCLSQILHIEFKSKGLKMD